MTKFVSLATERVDDPLMYYRVSFLKFVFFIIKSVVVEYRDVHLLRAERNQLSGGQICEFVFVHVFFVSYKLRLILSLIQDNDSGEKRNIFIITKQFSEVLNSKRLRQTSFNGRRFEVLQTCKLMFLNSFLNRNRLNFVLCTLHFRLRAPYYLSTEVLMFYRWCFDENNSRNALRGTTWRERWRLSW